MSLPLDRSIHPGRWAALALLLAAGFAHVALAPPQKPCAARAPAQAAASPPAPAPKTLSEADSKRVDELRKATDGLWREGKFSEAIAPARQAVAICERTLGTDHWQTADKRRLVERLRTMAALPAEGRRVLSGLPALDAAGREAYNDARYDEAVASWSRSLEVRRRWLGERHPDTALSYNNLAAVLRARGDLTGAEAMNRKALAIRIETLGERHPDTAQSYNNLAGVLLDRGDLTGAEALHRKDLAIQLAVLGERHPDTATSYNNLATVLHAGGDLPGAEAMHRKALAIRLAARGERHRDTAVSYSNLATVLYDRGDLPGAEVMHRKALAIRLELLGERHPDTATSYNNLATVLYGRGDLTGAEAMHRKDLAIQLAVLGERHPSTALSYNNLAIFLHTRGDLTGAEAMHRKALAIQLAVLGERHPSTAQSYTNLATVLHARGDLAGAEAMFRKALAIWIAALGERHPSTATSYDHLAMVLRARGDLTGAEAMLPKALAIRIEVLGERHPSTAQSYNNLAAVLKDRGDLTGAEAMHRKTLAIRIEVLGERHRDTATSYDDLAVVLLARGDLPGAEAMHRKALAIRIETLGERHRDTATSYNNLAQVLHARGDLAGAEAMLRKGLAIWIETVGERHSGTVTNYTWLAVVLAGLGRSAQAIDALENAARASTEVRKRSRGLEDAAAVVSDPFPLLAALLARAGRPGDAWNRWERGLSRALLDEVAGRAARPLTDDERRREAALLDQAQAGDERINRLLARGKPTPEVEKQLDALRSGGSEIRRSLLELQQQLEQKYGPLAGQPATLEAARAALDDTSALVGWVADRYHSACVLRRSDDPIWVEIPGSGKDGAWTKGEEVLARRLRAALASQSSDWSPLAAELARQRLAPLEPHLNGVKRVVVVNSPGLAGLPVEVLFAARAQDGRASPIVAYAPSASMFAYLAGKKPAQPRPDTLLAVGDPAYPESKPEPAPPAPPSSGLFIAAVDPKGNAGARGVRSGDVMLTYDGVPLKSPADLKLAPAEGPPRKVPLHLWRHGQEQTVEVEVGRLGISYDRRLAAEVILAHRAAAEVLRGSRAEAPTRLPGTRREVKAVAGLFPDGLATTLLGDQARESVVQEMAHSGKLKGFRYLHFATHGRDDPASAYRTALLLAPDSDRSADPLAVDTDGEITALEIARTWELDAELVVLSACETALGRYAGGEGFLGFAQPLLFKGTRSLVLSLWRVDDKATSLLMVRFYQNLLGKRPGLSIPLPKAEALHEAKEWLRNLTQDQVGDELAALDRGEVRPLVKTDGLATGKSSFYSKMAGVRPYAHPYYWAAFILIGDPG
jgi:CHAT domain-containing protein/tetratricopeptide (TPR) repeat protein